jgi:hypothetical protein
MKRRTFLSRLAQFGVLLAVSPAILMTGCITGATLSALVSEIGSAISGIVTQIGNTALAAQLSSLFAAAAAAIASWKSGTIATSIIQILTDIETNLNLLPPGTPYEGLIELALGAIIAVIQILSGSSSASTPAVKLTAPNGQYVRAIPPFKLPGVESPKAAFIKAWNAICATIPQAASLVRR